MNVFMQEICEFEKNPENNDDIHYRNALRHLLRSSYVRQEVNESIDEDLRFRESVDSFYHYMFGKHPAEKEGSQLFSESQHTEANAEIKANDEVSQFYDYIAGYREAADTIVKNAMIRGNQRHCDLSVFPICFLYRQYIELSLKDIYLYYSADSDDDKKTYIKNATHSLSHVWEHKVSPMLQSLVDCQLQRGVDKLDAYIREFHNLDESSMLFRYPIDKNRKQYHTVSQKINIIGLMEKMNEIEGILAFFSALLDVEKIKAQAGVTP